MYRAAQAPDHFVCSTILWIRCPSYPRFISTESLHTCPAPIKGPAGTFDWGHGALNPSPSKRGLQLAESVPNGSLIRNAGS